MLMLAPSIHVLFLKLRGKSISSGEPGIWQLNAMMIALQYWENECLPYL